MTAILNAQPVVRLITEPAGQYIEVWHVPQPERYHILRQTWVEEPGHIPVRHVHAVQEASTA